MQSILIEKLRAFIVVNNPDLVFQLQADYSITKYLEDKVAMCMPMLENLILEGKPQYIIEELCLNEMTSDLRPSKFNYIKEIIEEDFPEDYARLAETGVLTYETINLIETCKDHFENFDFSESTADNRLLRYAIIAAIHDYFN